MPKIATMEQSIPLQVQTQKQVLIMALERHKEYIEELIESIEKAQTLDELFDSMRVAANNMV